MRNIAALVSVLSVATSILVEEPVYLPPPAKFCANAQRFCSSEVVIAAKGEISLQIGSTELMELTTDALKVKNKVLTTIETAKLEFYAPLNATTDFQAAEIYPDRTVIKNSLQPRNGMTFRDTPGATSTNCSALGAVGVLGLVNGLLSYCGSDMTWKRVV